VEEHLANGREEQLEAMLTAANRQLLERDDELIRIARDRELLQARETLQEFEQRLIRYAGELDELNATIAEMQATRAWRLEVRRRQLGNVLRRFLRRGS
jgi:hypothetical protein